MAAKTGSVAKIKAVCVGLAKRCAMVCAQKAKAVARMPVKAAANQTLPAGHLGAPSTTSAANQLKTATAGNLTGGEGYGIEMRGKTPDE